MMRRTFKIILRIVAKNLALLLMCIAVYAFVMVMMTEKSHIISKLSLNGTFIPVVNDTQIFRQHSASNVSGTTPNISTIKHEYPHSYKYIYTPANTCNLKDGSLEPLMVILVKSDVRNFENRIAIRSTWGNISDTSVKLVFLLGESPFLRDYVRMEYALFNDILQEDFFDNYYNNTLKTIMAFNWSLNNCRKTAYFFFVDDDYLVNTRLLLEHVYKIKPQSIYTGCVWYGAKPNRNIWKKWYVSEKEYPEKAWPPYITGGSYLISRDNALQLQRGFQTIKPLYIDDVYMGIIAKTLDIKLTNDNRFHPHYKLDKIQQFFSIHHFDSPRQLYKQWESLKDKLKA